jgi:hypothetical protein
LSSLLHSILFLLVCSILFTLVIFFSITGFQQLDCNMLCYCFLWDCSAWVSLRSLNLRIYSFHQIWKKFNC